MSVKTPWYGHMGVVPRHLDYFRGSMEEAVEQAADKYPEYKAYDFMGNTVSYRRMMRDIRACAASLRACGVKPDQRVTVCLPNTPMAVCIFYAVNRIGAVANMIHPLSAEGEIEFYLNTSGSVAAITVDMFYEKFANVRSRTPELKTMIVCSISDGLKPLMKVGYTLTEGRKIKALPRDGGYITWKKFLKAGKGVSDARCARRADDPAAILYSGGTTGVTKGILLSNFNFNALSAQLRALMYDAVPGDSTLALMPMFHGFGLGVCIHSMLVNGGRCILVPRLNIKTFAGLLNRYKPNYIAGVPTLFEALMRAEGTDRLDMSCLKAVFCGGDSLSVERKKRFDAFLKAHGAGVTVREGYGTTECVTVSCVMPSHEYRENSIGIPLPDTYYKIVKPGTEDELPYGEEGEICLAGPTVMLEYVNNPGETSDTRRTHADGLTWIHTGDLGAMDKDGFVYFRQRIKRLIITGGYNVYPSRLENILDAHEAVNMSCVIGVKDQYKMQKVKAFVALKSGYEASEEQKKALLDYCGKKIAKYALPYDIEFRTELPMTLVGKVAYRVLEEEEKKKS